MTARKKKWEWQDDFDRVSSFASNNGGDVAIATDKHVAFRYIKGTVRVVFYPHKAPSAQGYHLRARIEGGNREASLEAIREINRAGNGREYWVNNRGWPGNPNGMEWGVTA